MRGVDGEYKKYASDEQQRLLAAVIEELKVPFLQIANQSELNSIMGKPDDGTIQLITQHALKLLDHYALSVRLVQEKARLEPVSLGAVLHSSAHSLSRFAEMHGCELRIEAHGHYAPVLAHKQGLEAVIESLGTAMIQSQSQMGGETSSVTLAVHRSRWGLVAGAYANMPEMNAAVLRRAKTLFGKARQPLNHILASNGAGVFVADALLSAMASHLHASRHHKLNGLAATLQPSQQMALM